MTTFQASRREQAGKPGGPPPTAYPEIGILSDVDARLYFAYRLPNWPPHYLIIKLLRRALWPLFKRQVFFNMACRDLSIQAHNAQRDMAHRNSEMEQRVRELEEQVQTLSAQVEEAALLLAHQQHPQQQQRQR